MEQSICIVQKPSTVSWQQIKDCLMAAHNENRNKGILLSHPLWPAEQIGSFVEESGVLFVALDAERVVGTLGVKEKTGNYWFVKGRYAYLCFGSILPEYQGRGIYKALNNACEEYIKEKGFKVFVLDTHASNHHMKKISLKSGFRLVRFFHVAGPNPHNSVMMAKWVDVCPFSNSHCRWQFFISKMKAFAKMVLSREK